MSYRTALRLLLAAALPACASPPPPPPPRPPPAAPTVKPADDVPPPPRAFSDLGPPRLVPQIGVDASWIALSPDGLLALTGGGTMDTTVQVWDVDRKVVVAELAPPTSLLRASFGFTKDGRFIVGESIRSAAVWDGSTGRLVGVVSGSDPPPDFDYDRPAPEALVYDERRKAVVLRTFEPGPDLFQVPAPGGAPLSLAISGQRYTIVWDGSEDVYDRSGKRIPDGGESAPDSGTFKAEEPHAPPASLHGQVKGASCLQAGGRAVCAAYEDSRHEVYVADLRAREPRLEALPARLPGNASFQEEGQGLLLECQGDQTGTFGFEAGSEALAAAERRRRVRAAAKKDAPGAELVEAKSSLLAVVDGRIAVWDVAAEKKRADIVDQSISRNGSVAPSPDGKLLAVGGGTGDTRVGLFDLEKGALLRTLDHGHSVWGVLWNPDGAVLLTSARMLVGGYHLADPEASIKLWSPRTGKVLRTLGGHFAAAYSRDNSLFVTWEYSEVRVYDARTMKSLARAGGASMYAILSPDGKSMITPRMDTSASHPGLYDLAGIDVRSTRTGAVLRTFDDSTGLARWSPDSARLLLPGSTPLDLDDARRGFDFGVYSAATGRREQFWSGPGAVERVDWAMGGKLVVASVRGMIRLARVADGASLWIQPVMVGGRCTAVAFDDATGRFEAEDAALSGVGFRLGDDLRRSDVVHAGPKVEALRAPGLYRSFIAGEQ